MARGRQPDGPIRHHAFSTDTGIVGTTSLDIVAIFRVVSAARFHL
jgi:hypothetical protein